MSFERLFSSDRLVYHALENTGEDKKLFFNTMVNDPISFAQFTDRLLRPLTFEICRETLTEMTYSLLAVTICLPKGPDRSGKADTFRDPTPVGWLTLNHRSRSRHHRSCELTIFIITEHQGKGYGTEAITWALNWAFGVAGIHVVRLSCFSFNTQALKLYDRLGFVREGVDREAYYYNSRWHDGINLSMLESEWVSLKHSDIQDVQRDRLQVEGKTGERTA